VTALYLEAMGSTRPLTVIHVNAAVTTAFKTQRPFAHAGLPAVSRPLPSLGRSGFYVGNLADC
jgi:hypothetical protein